MAESVSTEESDLEFSSPGSNSSIRLASEQPTPAKRSRILCPHCDSMLSRRSFFCHKSRFLGAAAGSPYIVFISTSGM